MFFVLFGLVCLAKCWDDNKLDILCLLCLFDRRMLKLVGTLSIHSQTKLRLVFFPTHLEISDQRPPATQEFTNLERKILTHPLKHRFVPPMITPQKLSFRKITRKIQVLKRK